MRFGRESSLATLVRCCVSAWQKVHQADQAAHRNFNGKEVDGLLGNSHLHQQLVHRTDVREQGVKQHGEGGGHDQVGHINDRLEELLALDVQPVAGEEDGQQQSDDDLGNRAAQPQHHGVAGIFNDVNDTVGIRGEKLDVVGQTHEVGADLLQAGTVVLEEAVVNGQEQGIKLENGIGDEKGRDEQVAPLQLSKNAHGYVMMPLITRFVPSQRFFRDQI